MGLAEKFLAWWSDRVAEETLSDAMSETDRQRYDELTEHLCCRQSPTERAARIREIHTIEKRYGLPLSRHHSV